MNKFPIGKIPFVLRFWWLWEVVTFILIGLAIGFGWAILILMLGSLFGFLLIRGQGISMMKQVKSEPIQGAFALMNAIENSFIILSGFLFLIPGFITDFIGIICLVPAIRRRLIRKLLGFNLKDFTRPAANQPTQATQPKPSNTIEGECWHEDSSQKKND